MSEGPSAHLNLGCLSIFWTPKTLAGKVDLSLAHALLDHTGGSWPERMRTYHERFVSMLDASDPGVVFNFSAIVHETRHFHDLLLTAWGQGAFVHAVTAIHENLRLFRALQNVGVSKVSVPVMPEDFPHLKELVTQAQWSVQQRDAFWQHGQSILEMLAYWAQHQFVWKNVEDKATLENYFEHISEQIYHQAASIWSQRGLEWKLEPEEWVEISYPLLVACLNAGAPDKQFLSILKQTNPKTMPWSEAKAFFNGFLHIMEEEAEKNRLLLAEWTAHLRDRIKNDELLDAADRRTLIGLIDSYDDKQTRMFNFVSKDPGRFRSLDGYISKTILAGTPAPVVAPRIYCYYPDNFSFVHPGSPSGLPDDFFYADVYESAPSRMLKRLSEVPKWGAQIRKIREEQPGWTCAATELRVHPVVNLFSSEDNIMPSEWGRFARDLAGCVVLSEGISWDDPVRYHWAKKTARHAGLIVIPKAIALT